MENKEQWNKEDWQGRRKDQIEYSYMVIGACIVITLIVSGMLFFIKSMK